MIRGDFEAKECLSIVLDFTLELLSLLIKIKTVIY